MRRTGRSILALCLCLALWHGTPSSHAATPPAIDRLATPGCIPRAESRQLIADQGAIALQLGGMSIDDTGRMLELDQGNAFFNFYLIVYRRESEIRLTLAKHSLPLQMDPTDLCIMVAAKRGNLGDARAGHPGIDNALTFDAQAGRAQCRRLRPGLQASVDRQMVMSEGRLSSLGEVKKRAVGEWDAHLTQLNCRFGGTEACRAYAEQKLEQAAAKAREVEEKGDELCGSIAARLEKLGSACRLVAQLLGNDLNDDGKEAGFSIVLCDPAPRGAWHIFKTYPSGATTQWAGGAQVGVNGAYYEAPYTPLPPLTAPR